VSSYLDVVGRGRAIWQDRRRAWNRLNGWHNENPNAVPGHPDDGDEALQALADIHLVRGLLDRPELVAVTTAPRHGKSWSEIGTTLHVSRQAARDRWHDIEAGQPTPA
jgi:hypothetical protein